MRSLSGTAFFIAALLLAAAPARGAAQARVPALRMGQEVQETLSASDPALTGGARFKVYRFDARPDRTYRFTAVMPQGAPALRVARPAGVLTEMLAEAAGMDTVQLRFRPLTAGPYLVVVSSDSAAAFSLRGDEIGSGPPVPRPVAIGQLVQDTLTAESALADDETETVYDLFTFPGRAGQQVMIQAFGAYGVVPSLGRLREGRFEEISTDEDSFFGGWVSIPEDGEYAARVQGRLDEAGENAYTMRLWDPASRPAPRRVEVGQSTGGTLDPIDAFPADGQATDEWVVTASAGQRLTITAAADSFDTYLSIGREQNGAFQEIVNDDDGGEGSNSLAVLDVPQAGEYIVRVRAYVGTPAGKGEYTLQVAEARPAVSVSRRQRPETRPVRWGTSITGSLDENDAVLPDGTLHDAFTFSATAGQRVTITLSSTAFDAYLAVGRMEGGAFLELSSNDDYVGGEGGAARVVMVAPETGEFVIHVNTYQPGASGAYTLTVERGR
jgi:hypothetical protein